MIHILAWARLLTKSKNDWSDFMVYVHDTSIFPLIALKLYDMFWLYEQFGQIFPQI